MPNPTNSPPYTLRDFVCTSCGQSWQVDESWELHHPNESAAKCPECDRIGKLITTKVIYEDFLQN
jgi:NAD-dependent SIR2 family protein deacetylase